MHLIPLSSCCNHGIFSSQCSWKQRSCLSSYFLLSALVATFSCFRFTPGLAFGEKDIGHPTITEYLSLTGQGKLRNRKIISERKQTFYRNSLQVRRTNKESIFFGQSDNFQELCSDQHRWVKTMMFILLHFMHTIVEVNLQVNIIIPKSKKQIWTEASWTISTCWIGLPLDFNYFHPIWVICSLFKAQ